MTGWPARLPYQTLFGRAEPYSGSAFLEPAQAAKITGLGAQKARPRLPANPPQVTHSDSY